MSISASRLKRLAALEQRNAERFEEMAVETLYQIAPAFSQAQFAVLARLYEADSLLRPDLLSGSDRELAEAFREAWQQHEGQKIRWAAYAQQLGSIYRETT